MAVKSQAESFGRSRVPGGEFDIPTDRDQRSWVCLNNPKNTLPLTENPKNTLWEAKSLYMANLLMEGSRRES